MPRALALLVLLAAGLLEAFPEWSRFRGPNGTGVAEAHGLPLRFGREKNLIWKTELPPGHSSPILSDERIFLTAVEEERLYTYGPGGSLEPLAVDEYDDLIYATPAIAGDRIYIRTRSELFCFGRKGK